MRVALTVVLAFGLLALANCAEPGTAENPLPEDHEDEAGESDEDAGEDGADGEEGEGDDDKLGEADGASDPLSHYEDTGEGDKLTEKHMHELHAKLDGDKNGKVHMEEIMHFAQKTKKAVAAKEIAGIFDEIESTRDGTLSLEEHMSEVAEFHEGDAEEKEKQKQAEIAKFKAADLDGDDKLDKTELIHLMHPDTHAPVLEVHTNEEMRKRDTDGDGKLSNKEWNVEATPGEHQDKENHDPDSDFKRLDANADGFVDLEELRHWESGRFHTEDAMKKLFEVADKDSDLHITADEFAEARDMIAASDAQYHLIEWAEHHEL